VLPRLAPLTVRTVAVASLPSTIYLRAELAKQASLRGCVGKLWRSVYHAM